MKKFCPECEKEVTVNIVNRKESYKVYGEEIEVDARIMVCSECREELYNEELDNETLINAYNQYRKKHKLLMPEEIREIRETYGLSQRSFAKLLNWGDKTVHRYENGSLQDKAHNSLLSLLRNPYNMKEYLNTNEVGLEGNQVQKLKKRVEELLENQGSRLVGNQVVDILFQREPDIENGFKSFDFEKFCAVVLFFAKQFENLLKVKLLKLLNYSDMIYYKENGVSMTGTQYIHFPYGPVPRNFDILLGLMEAQDIIRIQIQFEYGYEKHQIISNSDMYEELLNDGEYEVLERVYNKFKNFGSAEISNYSHQEKGYRETVQGQTISYEYAKDIELD